VADDPETEQTQPTIGDEPSEQMDGSGHVNGFDADMGASDDSDAPVEMSAAAEQSEADQESEAASAAESEGMPPPDAMAQSTMIGGTAMDGHEPGGDVRAANVSISQGGARDVYASTVSISQGGAGQVRADSLKVSMGGVGMARTQDLTIEQGGSAFAVGADHATVADGGNVFVLLARSVSGDVRPLLDWRAALALGAGFALVRSLFRGHRRR
jgi:hypothetical protein